MQRSWGKRKHRMGVRGINKLTHGEKVRNLAQGENQNSILTLCTATDEVGRQSTFRQGRCRGRVGFCHRTRRRRFRWFRSARKKLLSAMPPSIRYECWGHSCLLTLHQESPTRCHMLPESLAGCSLSRIRPQRTLPLWGKPLYRCPLQCLTSMRTRPLRSK